MSNGNNDKFWKNCALVLLNIIVFFLGGVITLLSPIADYYRDKPVIELQINDLKEHIEKHDDDAPIVDKRLADLETRVDRNDARLEHRYSQLFEQKLMQEREEYEPILKAAQD